MVLIHRNKKIAGALVIFMVALAGCNVEVSYKFSGASISLGVKTVSVQYFQNRASQVQPTLSQDITDALIDKCKAQTNLKVVSSGGDVSFEGYITDYKSLPFTATSTEQSAMNRFTISVKVKFVNSVDPDLSYEQTFTRYEEYSSSLELSSVEATLSKDIVELLVEDIFNKAFVNW
jgi:hypothetical protein